VVSKSIKQHLQDCTKKNNDFGRQLPIVIVLFSFMFKILFPNTIAKRTVGTSSFFWVGNPPPSPPLPSLLEDQHCLGGKGRGISGEAYAKW